MKCCFSDNILQLGEQPKIIHDHMPQTSQRGQAMPESPIRKLVPLSDKAKARGIKVYHLNIGQPDLKTPEVALEAIRNIDRTVLEYSPSDGIRSLKTKLAAYYHTLNIS